VAIDLEALERDLNALRAELRAESGPEDVEHLRKMARWGKLATMLGWATAWIPNPLSMLALSTGIFARWAMIAHHTLHRGYDKIEGTPERFTSRGFAQGARRWLDWSDWMDPEAWRHEHNTLHHYRLGERRDPDQPEHNFESLRRAPIPSFVRRALVLLAAMLWKPFYYAPNTMLELHAHRAKADPVPLASARAFAPWCQPGRALWLRCWLPYLVLHFGLLPLPFLALGPQTWIAALVNRAGAEILTNLHAFIVIVPNHAGEDIYRFDEPIENRGEFYLRQIVGSTNYRTGGDLNDFLHGWLNYQIEHHLWPDMSMLAYRRAAPRVEAICRAHGLPYVQESVWRRLGKLVDVAVGRREMPRWSETPLATETHPA
jgi:fatty acid desaturase